MKFSELSPKVQAKLREQEVSHDWWEFTYEDAARMGKILGIEIHNRSSRTVGGRPLDSPDIYFDLGRGGYATFNGRFEFRPESVDEIKRETTDEELIRIAELISSAFVKWRLLGIELPTAILSHNNHSVYVDTSHYDNDYEELREAIKSFAEWIYRSLETECDYLQSDEHLSECDYEEDGTRI
jgi:hypothetical protein